MLLLAALLSVVAPASAWGPRGHQIVALIAQDRLREGTRAKVRELLGPGAGLDALANCPDAIRDGSEPVHCGSFDVAPDSTTAPWHVLGIPLASTPSASSIDAACGGACLLSAIASSLNVLSERTAPRLDRQKALMYLVHFAGDLHQPLHCALDGAPVEFRRRFGNTRRISWNGKKLRLHRLWDQLVRTGHEANALASAAYAKRLESSITPAEAADWVKGDFLRAAALESFQIARDDVYAPLDRAQDRMTDAEIERARAIADRRLRMAGVRLAAWIEAALR